MTREELESLKPGMVVVSEYSEDGICNRYVSFLLKLTEDKTSFRTFLCLETTKTNGILVSSRYVRRVFHIDKGEAKIAKVSDG